MRVPIFIMIQTQFTYCQLQRRARGEHVDSEVTFDTSSTRMRAYSRSWLLERYTGFFWFVTGIIYLLSKAKACGPPQNDRDHMCLSSDSHANIQFISQHELILRHRLDCSPYIVIFSFRLFHSWNCIYFVSKSPLLNCSFPVVLHWWWFICWYSFNSEKQVF